MSDAMLWSCRECRNVRSTSWPSEQPEECPACGRTVDDIVGLHLFVRIGGVSR